jgi:hypothetical protein
VTVSVRLLLPCITAVQDQELYADLLAPHYKADIWCETWQNGVGALPNFCKPTYAENTFNIETYTVDGYTMGDTSDHSKVAFVADSDVVCVGDINRTEAQAKRGGGTVCFAVAAVHEQLAADAVHWTEPPRGGCAAAAGAAATSPAAAAATAVSGDGTAA